MKMMKHLNAMMLLLAMVLAVGCGKDDDTDNPNPNNPDVGNLKCFLTQVTEENDRRYKYEYDNSGRITREITLNYRGIQEYNRVYQYNGLNKVSNEILYLSSGIKPINKKEYIYNADSLIVSVIWFAYTDNNQFEIIKKDSIEYDASNRMIKNTGFSPLHPTQIHFYTFTYMNNQVRISEYSDSAQAPVLNNIRDIIFDDNPSAFHTLGYLNTNYPNYDKHNIISEKVTPYRFVSSPSEITYNYQYNKQGYPISVTAVINNVYGTHTKQKLYEYDCR